MAKVKAPFLSLSAVGSVAGTLTASTWKGIKTMRQKSHPANPRTPAQIAQRTKFSSCIAFWKAVFMTIAVSAGWDVAASKSGKPQSGFNAFVSSALKGLKASADAQMAFSLTCAGESPGTATVGVSCNMTTDGSVPTAGITSVKILLGFDPDNLVHEITAAYTTGSDYEGLFVNALAPVAGDTVYVKAIGVVGGVQYDLSGISTVVST